MRWLWAAYRLGLWRDLMDDDLSKSAFQTKCEEMLAFGDFDWIVDAHSGEGVRPVALILGVSLPGGRRLEPHIDWFPWATPRNKLEGAAAYLREASRHFKIFVYCTKEDAPFWTRLAQYRMLRRGCKIIDFDARGEDQMFFYTVGP